MSVKEIFLLGNPRLYEISDPVEEKDLHELTQVIEDLHDTLLDFKAIYGAGRAIAAPQIGVMKRLIYLFIEEPVVFINPAINQKSEEMIEVWDDCMCFPDLLVKVKRHRRITINYRDREWNDRSMVLEDDLSELLQHEYDHLDGILATARAVDERSFALKNQRHLLR